VAAATKQRLGCFALSQVRVGVLGVWGFGGLGVWGFGGLGALELRFGGCSWGWGWLPGRRLLVWCATIYISSTALCVSRPSTQSPPSPKHPTFPHFGQSNQVTYILGGQVGSNLGYLVGFGPRYPTQPQHRQASCPPWTKGTSPPACTVSLGLLSDTSDPSVIAGGLVAGPGAGDEYIDARLSPGSRVGVHYNVALMGALAGLVHNEVQPGSCQVRLDLRGLVGWPWAVLGEFVFVSTMGCRVACWRRCLDSEVAFSCRRSSCV